MDLDANYTMDMWAIANSTRSTVREAGHQGPPAPNWVKKIPLGLSALGFTLIQGSFNHKEEL
jgi:hypothetical protein